MNNKRDVTSTFKIKEEYQWFVLLYIPCQGDDEITKYEALVGDKHLYPTVDAVVDT